MILGVNKTEICAAILTLVNMMGSAYLTALSDISVFVWMDTLVKIVEPTLVR
jgi:hypothetical protein